MISWKAGSLLSTSRPNIFITAASWLCAKGTASLKQADDFKRSMLTMLVSGLTALVGVGRQFKMSATKRSPLLTPEIESRMESST